MKRPWRKYALLALLVHFVAGTLLLLRLDTFTVLYFVCAFALAWVALFCLLMIRADERNGDFVRPLVVLPLVTLGLLFLFGLLGQAQLVAAGALLERFPPPRPMFSNHFQTHGERGILPEWEEPASIKGTDRWCAWRDVPDNVLVVARSAPRLTTPSAAHFPVAGGMVVVPRTRFVVIAIRPDGETLTLPLASGSAARALQRTEDSVIANIQSLLSAEDASTLAHFVGQ